MPHRITSYNVCYTKLLRAVAQEDGGVAARAALTQFIASRYRVADEVVAGIVNAAYRAAEAHAVDPLVVLAVVSYNFV